MDEEALKNEGGERKEREIRRGIRWNVKGRERGWEEGKAR